MHYSQSRNAFSKALSFSLLACVVALPAQAAMHLPLISRTEQVITREVKQGDWRLKVETGKFSKENICHLEDRRHHITYAAGALGFRFAHNLNTLGAWVRIDDGVSIRWRGDLPELIRLGVPMDGASIDNPTDGIVWIPASHLIEASRITIQPDVHRRPVTFHLHGFAELRDSARELGCVPDARFSR